MAGINVRKVVIGGLLAGLVFNIGDMLLSNMVLAEDFRQAMTGLGMDPAAIESFAAAVPWIVIDFIYGLLVVWTYAAMRPRLGAGPKTALLAGMVLLSAAMLLYAGFTSMGIFPVSLFVKQLVLEIVVVAAGSLAGGWVYSEE